jgi:hypothetical protein
MEEDAMTFADYEERARFEENYAPEGTDLRYGPLARCQNEQRASNSRAR